MVLARLDWDITMHRVVMVLLGQLDAQETSHFCLQRVRARRIRDIAQVTQKSIHQEVARAAEKLDEATIGVWKPENREHERVPVFVRCVYKSRRGILEARFADALRAHVGGDETHGGRYPLRYGMRLSTPYAIRAYEISKMIASAEGEDEKRLPISLFRRVLKLEDKYRRHCDMRRRVIAPAISEVSEKTDVRVQCSDVREGQTPVALKWRVERKDGEERTKISKGRKRETVEGGEPRPSLS
jgi:plasmid replication initiation protein